MMRTPPQGLLPDGIVTPQKTTFIDHFAPTNLFDKDSEDNTSNFFIHSNGTLTAAEHYAVSHKIAANAGETWVISYNGACSDAMVGAVYDANLNWLANITNVTAATGNAYRTIVLPINANIAYIRINTYDNLLSTFMIVKGTTFPAEYTAYFATHDDLSNDITIPDSQMVNIAASARIRGNPLYGKKITQNGDSIFAGTVNSYVGGALAIIAARNGMTFHSVAEGGATIMSETYAEDEVTQKHWICQSITDMASDADYAIFDGGVNDAFTAELQGSMTTDWTTAFDDTTFLGAFESCCSQLMNRYAGKKYGFVFVHGIFALDNYYNTTRRPAMITILKKWGIPYLDLQNEVPPLNFIDALKTAYTINGDGWHPNLNGYLHYYCDKIEAWLKTL